MIVSSTELSVSEVVRAYQAADAQTLYGVWRPSDRRRKTFSVHTTEPTDSLKPSEMVLEISDGRAFPIEQPVTYEEHPGEHGLAWTRVMGRPTIRTEHGPRSTLEFEPEAEPLPRGAVPIITSYLWGKWSGPAAGRARIGQAKAVN